jgi:hypothetical protein
VSKSTGMLSTSYLNSSQSSFMELSRSASLICGSTHALSTQTILERRWYYKDMPEEYLYRQGHLLIDANGAQDRVSWDFLPSYCTIAYARGDVDNHKAWSDPSGRPRLIYGQMNMQQLKALGIHANEFGVTQSLQRDAKDPRSSR